MASAASAAAVMLLAVIFAACTMSDSSDGKSSEPTCAPSRTYSDQAAAVNVEPMGPPVWTMTSNEATFSSPALADLNDDGVLDVVQGFGQDTLGAGNSSVVATDGSTGAELWRSSGHEDLVGTARFVQLGGDSTLDVAIGGRRGALLGIDGANGSLLWTFDNQNGRWFNFYTSQIVDDQNGDGVDDLVAANGGLVFDEPQEGAGLPDPEDRNLGTTFLVSGADGSVLASLPAPDRREQYMSPILIPSNRTPSISVDPEIQGDADSVDLDLLIGTGGETLPGAVWRIPLGGLADDNKNATGTEVVSGADKGIIASPSLADLTGDCVLDIVVQSFGGTLSAVNGATNTKLWSLENPGFETYSTPTLGYFVGDDDVADVFVGMAQGVWPEYKSSDYLLVDGSTGAVVWREALGTFAPSGFVAADLNGDGRDEVIFGVNDLEANTHQFHVLDTTMLQATSLGPALPQTTFSSPWLGDIDSNGRLDLIATESAYQSNGATRVHRFELPWLTPDAVTWGGYLGTVTDGSLFLPMPQPG